MTRPISSAPSAPLASASPPDVLVEALLALEGAKRRIDAADAALAVAVAELARALGAAR